MCQVSFFFLRPLMKSTPQINRNSYIYPKSENIPQTVSILLPYFNRYGWPVLTSTTDATYSIVRSTGLGLIVPTALTRYLGLSVKTCRPAAASAIFHFGQWIIGCPWTGALSMDGVETKWDKYISTIMGTYHHFFPEKSMIPPSWCAMEHTHIKRLMQ